jgi:hypothetical protein
LLGRVRVPSVPRRRRSYWALRRLAFFGRRSGRPSLHGPPRVGCFFFAGRRCTLDPRRVGDSWSGSPFGLYCPRKGEALPGYWVVLLKRAAVRDPAERAVASPYDGGGVAAFRELEPLGAREPTVSRLYSRGPRPCVPTHHPVTSLPPEQGSLPACRAGLWPRGLRTRWTTDRNFVNHRMIHSFPTSVAWSHRVRVRVGPAASG